MIRTFILTTGLFLALASLNCNGTRFRKANLDVSLSTIQTQLAQLQAIAQKVGDSTITTQMNAFFTLYSDPNATLYYAEAPSPMGSVSVVMPVDFEPLVKPGAQFNQDSLTKLYAYFVIVHHDDGFRGGLIMAGSDGVTPSDVGNIQPLDNTTSPAPSGTPVPQSASLTFAKIAVNDGQVQTPGSGGVLPAGIVSNGYFSMEMNLEDRVHMMIRTDDAINGDLTKVIQLKLYVDDGNPDFGLIGQVNLLQP